MHFVRVRQMGFRNSLEGEEEGEWEGKREAYLGISTIPATCP